jgi:hypothetical protein
MKFALVKNGTSATRRLMMVLTCTTCLFGVGSAVAAEGEETPQAPQFDPRAFLDGLNAQMQAAATPTPLEGENAPVITPLPERAFPRVSAHSLLLPNMPAVNEPGWNRTRGTLGGRSAPGAITPRNQLIVFGGGSTPTSSAPVYSS